MLTAKAWQLLTFENENVKPYFSSLDPGRAEFNFSYDDILNDMTKLKTKKKVFNLRSAIIIIQLPL